MSDIPDDNLDAAMAMVANSIEPTVTPSTGSTPGAPATKQVLIRAAETDAERWRRTAEGQGLSVSEWVRRLCNAAAQEYLDCAHPEAQRIVYPWAGFCGRCGIRLWG